MGEKQTEASPTSQSPCSPENSDQQLSGSALKDKRIDELLDSCRDEVLKQIIGPFGLTPAMFNDIAGGNVTTLHNFNEGIVANSEDATRYAQYQQNLDGPIDRSFYDGELPGKRKAMFQTGEAIRSAWTGNELPRDGRMHLDHVTPVEKIERRGRSNLVMSKEERAAMANADENLVPAESDINQSMGDKNKGEWAAAKSRREPSKTNAEHFGVDMERVRATIGMSERHIDAELFNAQFLKQGEELLVTGTEQAGRNALRQATGLLLHEFINGSYVEVKRIAKEPSLQETFVDHLIEALRNVVERIKGKLEHIFENLVSGGIQGLVSNLLTYIINSVVTTAAKVVTVIREGMKGLWEAIKLVVNPPPGMPAAEVARQATKIIAAVVTTSLGLLFEKSVEGFILSIPLLAPLSGVITPAITAILTGIVTALVVFGIDKFFDWLSASGTEMLTAQIDNMEASGVLFERMAQMLQAQFDNSKQYQLCIEQYREIQADLSRSNAHSGNAVRSAEKAIESREGTLSAVTKVKAMDDELEILLVKYDKNSGG